MESNPSFYFKIDENNNQFNMLLKVYDISYRFIYRFTFAVHMRGFAVKKVNFRGV